MVEEGERKGRGSRDGVELNGVESGEWGRKLRGDFCLVGAASTLSMF